MDLIYVFKLMFPDSDLLQTFPCKRRKTAHVAGFGLAPSIGTLVVIFNESLNQMAKAKQLAVLVCYWIKLNILQLAVHRPFKVDFFFFY